MSKHITSKVHALVVKNLNGEGRGEGVEGDGGSGVCVVHGENKESRFAKENKIKNNKII